MAKLARVKSNRNRKGKSVMLFWDRNFESAPYGWDLCAGIVSEDGRVIADMMDDGNGGYRPSVAVADDRGVWYVSDKTSDWPMVGRLLGKDWRWGLDLYAEWALEELGSDDD